MQRRKKASICGKWLMHSRTVKTQAILRNLTPFPLIQQKTFEKHFVKRRNCFYNLTPSHTFTDAFYTLLLQTTFEITEQFLPLPQCFQHYLITKFCL